MPQGEPGEREPKFARRSPFTLVTKLCPKCLGPLQSGNRLGGWLIPMDYYCTKCGYSGSVYVEKDRDSEQGNE